MGRHVSGARRRRRARTHDLPLLHRRARGSEGSTGARLLPVVQRHRLVQDRGVVARGSAPHASRVSARRDGFPLPHAGTLPRQAERTRTRRRRRRCTCRGARHRSTRDRRPDTRQCGARLRRRPLTPTQIRELLSAHGLRPSRALGQNFLADPNTARRIARLANIEPGDQVVEVGPGVGSLTVALVDAGAHVRAIELDRHLVPVLEDVVADRSVDVMQADAMHVDWSEVLDATQRWVMVSNLPYNVATPVVLRALEEAPMIDRYLVMVQREVGARLAAGIGDDQYGAVSVKVAYYASAKVVGLVPPTVFIPRPKVDSALLQLQRRAAPAVDVVDDEWMFSLVRAGFATRRKTLRRALSAVLGERTISSLVAAGIDPAARAETITLEQWATLANGTR